MVTALRLLQSKVPLRFGALLDADVVAHHARMHERAVVIPGELARRAGAAAVDHDGVERIVGWIRARQRDPERVEAFLCGVIRAGHVPPGLPERNVAGRFSRNESTASRWSAVSKVMASNATERS